MFKIKLEKHTNFEVMFLAVWTFYSIFYVLITATEVDYEYHDIASSLLRYCRYITVILLICIFLLIAFVVKKWNWKQLALYLTLLVVTFIVELRISDWNLLILVLFVLSAQFLDFNKFLRYDIKLKILLLLIIFAICALGIIENRSVLVNGVYKMALGFSHPNKFSCYVLTILVEWLCIRFKKIKWFEWLAILAALIVTYNISYSRTSIYTFIVILVLFLIANYWQRFFQTKVVRIILTAIPAFMIFFSFYTVYLYSKGNIFAIALNSFVTGRIRLSYSAIRSYGIKWFGQEIAFSSRGNPSNNETIFTIDNAYVRMSLSWGMIIACIIVLVYMVRFYQLSKVGQINVLLLGIFFIVLGFGESLMIDVCYNVTLLCLLGIPSASGTNKNLGSGSESIASDSG